MSGVRVAARVRGRIARVEAVPTHGSLDRAGLGEPPAWLQVESVLGARGGPAGEGEACAGTHSIEADPEPELRGGDSAKVRAEQAQGGGHRRPHPPEGGVAPRPDPDLRPPSRLPQALV